MSDNLTLEQQLAQAEAEVKRIRTDYIRLRTQSQLALRQFGMNARYNDGKGEFENFTGGQRMLVSKADEYIRMGMDFEKVLEEIKSNMLLKAQWDKLLMSMRLTENKSE